MTDAETLRAQIPSEDWARFLEDRLFKTRERLLKAQTELEQAKAHISKLTSFYMDNVYWGQACKEARGFVEKIVQPQVPVSFDPDRPSPPATEVEGGAGMSDKPSALPLMDHCQWAGGTAARRALWEKALEARQVAALEAASAERHEAMASGERKNAATQLNIAESCEAAMRDLGAVGEVVETAFAEGFSEATEFTGVSG